MFCVCVCDNTINVSYIGLEDWYWQLDVNVMQKLVITSNDCIFAR